MKPRCCKWCNKIFTPKSNNQQYCTKKHAKEADKEKNRKRVQAFYKKNGRYIVGTGGIGGKSTKNFEIEIKIVNNELKRLNLRSNSLTNIIDEK